MDEENDLVIRGCKIVTPSGIIQSDMATKNTIISAIGHNLGAAKVDVSSRGKFIMPDCVDSHAHIEQMSVMGQINADTFETATRSAEMGGTTSIISFAAQTAGQSFSDTVANYTARARRGAMIDYTFNLTITDMTVLNFEDDLAALIATGHRSLKVFTTYNMQLSDQKILKVLTLARKYSTLVCVHAENDAIISNAKEQLLSAGHKAPRYYAPSRPRVAEIEAVERICRFAQYLDQQVMLFHIPTFEGASAVKAAQARGAPVLAETCPHYLFMTEEVLDQPGLEAAKFICSPPQRTTADQNALWQALKEGTLALVSSDHAPYRYDETGKLSAGPEAVFNEIANGLPGLETRLPLMFDAMVSRGEQGAQAFAQITATAPAKLYGLQKKGALVPGMDADIVIWDPDRKVTYGANDLSDNVGYNPWEGRTVTGWPEHVILRRKFLVKDGQFLGSVGVGNWIDRPEIATKPPGGSRQEFRT